MKTDRQRQREEEVEELAIGPTEEEHKKESLVRQPSGSVATTVQHWMSLTRPSRAETMRGGGGGGGGGTPNLPR